MGSRMNAGAGGTGAPPGGTMPDKKPMPSRPVGQPGMAPIAPDQRQAFGAALMGRQRPQRPMPPGVGGQSMPYAQQPMPQPGAGQVDPGMNVGQMPIGQGIQGGGKQPGQPLGNAGSGIRQPGAPINPQPVSSVNY